MCAHTRTHAHHWVARYIKTVLLALIGFTSTIQHRRHYDCVHVCTRSLGCTAQLTWQLFSTTLLPLHYTGGAAGVCAIGACIGDGGHQRDHGRHMLSGEGHIGTTVLSYRDNHMLLSEGHIGTAMEDICFRVRGGTIERGGR